MQRVARIALCMNNDTLLLFNITGVCSNCIACFRVARDERGVTFAW